MSIDKTDPAEIAYKLGQAHAHLRKAEKLLVDCNLLTENVADNFLTLVEFCNVKVMELK